MVMKIHLTQCNSEANSFVFNSFWVLIVGFGLFIEFVDKKKYMQYHQTCALSM